MTPISKIISQRVALGALTLWIVSLIVFAGVQFLPGDVATELLGQSATPEAVAALRKSMGLDIPLYLRYFDWLGSILRGNFGTALANGRDIAELIKPRLFNTLFLAVSAAVISVPLALLGGIVAALYRNTFIDRAINVVTLASISVPEFFVAYILILVLAVHAGILPSLSDVDSETSVLGRLTAIALPSLTLAVVVLAHMMRMTRTSIINLLGNQYIETARLKGLPEWRVLVRHALPNALAPIATVIVLNLAYLITGVVVVEVVFVYPGLGQLIVDSVQKRDVPVVQACSLIFAATYVLLNLTADILSIIANPRLMHPK
ncbi:ABC transporter permease [Mesorhizobium amorphae]|uniref:Binding-protein-dependent transport systems inner membrane component n=1 Tax=Mesorhizobium amorphae CCNWGS0123 TaxID=1082933 RepID=G6Y3E5_9HYPH|nr:ABC transporter permease [Mesorhizobium amorphae]ANT54896.1 ABC transporter permease [Mesorhizobium amorphae CCNWGS0123]EHH13735.1 binding-protein-dependent transport systems inner membrane component [Mesorhizobium amorphae CCNWGS0123]